MKARMNKSIVVGLLLGMSAVALWPTLAEAGTSLRLATGGTVTLAPEFELVSEGEGMPTLGVLLGLELDESFGVEVGLHYAGTSAQLFDLQQAGLRLFTLEVTAGYFQPIWNALGASVRLGVLGDLGRLQLESLSGGDRYRGWAAGFGLEGLLGLEIRSVIDQKRAVRFLLEAGYRWRPGALPFHHLKRKTAREVEVKRIELATIDAGTLRLSGAVISVSAGLSF